MLNKIKRVPLFTTPLAMFLLFILTTGCAPVSKIVPADYVDPVTMMEFVFIKGGSFEMGDHSQLTLRETPIHSVTVPDMAVGMYEVTFAQYDSFCEATGRKKPTDEEWGRGQRPVINITWHDANDFAKWLSSELSLNFNLPTEAQWEYFSRAGTNGNYWSGNKLPPNLANCRGCGSEWDDRMTAPVGSFKPNPWGLFDTAGNVAEWTLDDWQPGYEGAPTDGSAAKNASSNEKVYRGGAWNYPPKELKSATRDWLNKDDRNNTVGFRLILTNMPVKEKKK